MEYIKKEELIEGEIYKADNGSLTYIMKATKDLENVKNIPEYCEFMRHGCFNGSHLTFTNATPEEKHWLNCCITANKFITFEEAMKTFIPEYVECTLQQIGSDYKLGEIYKVSSTSQNVNKIESHNNQGMAFYQMNKHRFKPSTKESYDAQFVVIEPLPQFKVIETIETITKVENNEGNQFFIGDVVISDSGFVQTIKSFRYNVNKDNVLATTNVCNQISIARLEHYIEPKVEDQFKIGDTIKISTIPVDGSQPEYLNNNYKIIKIRGKQLLFETNSIPPIDSVLAKNAIKVN